MMRVVQALERHQATGSADGEIGRVIDQLADFQQIVEYGWVNRTGERSVVINVGEGLEDFGRKLKPRAMKGRYVAPMSIILRGLKSVIGHTVASLEAMVYFRATNEAAKWRLQAQPADNSDLRTWGFVVVWKARAGKSGGTDLLRHIISAGELGG